MATSIHKLSVPVSVLGEGPLWSERDHCLYFVDIASKRVQAYWPKDAAYEFWQFDEYTGSLAECKSGGLIVALADRVVRFDPKKGPSAVEDVVVLERDRPLNRLNDGKVDPFGRFWVGSMRVAEDDRAGRLWCVTAGGKASQQRDEIGVSNSLAFDRERQRMYFADSMTGVIEQAALGSDNPSPRFAPFARAGKGAPDGSCTDAEGFLWNAEWGGSRLVRYSPDGGVDRVLEVPVSRPSCCTFGGADYKTLYVTSARYNMSDAELAGEPQAGSLYAIELEDVRGLAPDLFAL
jgi:sugar lactone lactonase YvrE